MGSGHRGGDEDGDDSIFPLTADPNAALKKVAGDLVANEEKRAKKMGVDHIIGEVEEGQVDRAGCGAEAHVGP